jgi:hypothetical protein
MPTYLLPGGYVNDDPYGDDGQWEAEMEQAAFEDEAEAHERDFDPDEDWDEEWSEEML